MTAHQLETAAELLPWADPYIADLHRQHARELRRVKLAGEADGFNCRVRPNSPPRRSRYELRRLERTIRSRTPDVRAW